MYRIRRESIQALGTIQSLSVPGFSTAGILGVASPASCSTGH